MTGQSCCFLGTCPSSLPAVRLRSHRRHLPHWAWAQTPVTSSTQPRPRQPGLCPPVSTSHFGPFPPPRLDTGVAGGGNGGSDRGSLSSTMGRTQSMEEGPELGGPGLWFTQPPPGPVLPCACLPRLPWWPLQAAVRSESCWQLAAMPVKPPPQPTIAPCRPGFPSWSPSPVFPEALTCIAPCQHPPAPGGTGGPQLPAAVQ